ncbi:MAG: hypothetical protein E6I88_01845 [Chloroflexi bacterium]|nr:MAG: hypothetical protein E6I88_01845 [Chloroflexota bacterium]
MPRLVVLALDGFPHRAISPALTPCMWSFASAGGRAPDGGVTDLPSSTDPGFCSLLTGCHPRRHGVRTTSSADERWPPGGVIPPGTGLDAHGYPLNREVLPRLLDALSKERMDFVFGHFNESDTVGHDHGPESDAARECYAATDAVIGQVLDALADRWKETVIVVVSDHDMQARDDSAPIDPMAHSDGLWDLYVPDGGSALIHLRPGVDPAAAGAALQRLDGVETWMPDDASMVIAGAEPGRIFAAPRYPAGGFHGAPITARTVALVGGGHPAVGRLATAIERRRPHLADWVPTLAPLLGLELPGADGINFLG